MGGMVNTVELDALVAEALKNAIANGYDEVNTNEAKAVAIDLLSFDADVEAKMAEVEEPEDAINQVAESVTRCRNAQIKPTS